MDQILQAVRYSVRISHSEEGWITPLVDAVQGTSPEVARWKPGPDVASIWEIVAHALPYIRYRARDYTGETSRQEEDWPAIEDTSDQAWSSLQAELLEASAALQRGVDSASVDDFASVPEGKEGSRIQRLLDIVVHDSYHAGQIVKLRQLHAAAGPLPCGSSAEKA